MKRFDIAEGTNDVKLMMKRLSFGATKLNDDAEIFSDSDDDNCVVADENEEMSYTYLTNN